jgi:hypothetical protein
MLAEQRTLKWLRKVISDHVACRLVFDRHFAAVDSVLDHEMANVDVAGSLCAGRHADHFKFYRALVVLVWDGHVADHLKDHIGPSRSYQCLCIKINR